MIISQPTQIKERLRDYPLLLKYLRIVNNGLDFWNYFLKKKIKGKNNRILIDRTAICYKVSIDIEGCGNEVVVKGASILNNVKVFIRGNNNKIVISEKVRFIREGDLWIEDYNCILEIGESTTIEGAHLALTEANSKLSIGRDCMLAYNIDIRTGDSHSIINNIDGQRLNFAQSVCIEDHVWIGSHVSILKGVKIARNSVVATRAVVTKEFKEENVLIGGIPAKVLKTGINWLHERI